MTTVARPNADIQQPPPLANGNVDHAAGNNEQPPQAPSMGSIVKGLLTRALIIYMITSFFRKPQQPATDAPQGPALPPSQNLFAKNDLMDVYVYWTEDASASFASLRSRNDSLLWQLEGIGYGHWTGGPDDDGIYHQMASIDVSEAALRNSSDIFVHVYIVQSGRSPDPESDTYRKTHTIHKVKQLNRYMRRKVDKTHNLFEGPKEQDVAIETSAAKEPVWSHWHPNMTINIVDDHTPWTQGHVPHPLDLHVDFEPITGSYYPIVYMNDYWNLVRDYQPINETTPQLPIMLTFQPLSMFRFQLYVAQAMRSSWMSWMGQDFANEQESDQDTLKETLAETSPILLGITMAVSLLHSVFEFLAFKNDIQFWKNRNSLEGLSVRSVLFNVFQSLVVLLYILDQEANFLVKISVFVGLCIDIWKIHKVMNVNVEYTEGSRIPKIRIHDRSSYVESETRVYDEMAFKYLSWALFPCFAAYCVYSALYYEHKGWYSFFIGGVYGFLLTFGFIMMTPQLFINYKMKSVAHLPWRKLTYKFLNTFIDDIFAFVIKMPTMYRIGCFRDDIVFLIFLYQRWIYRVDPKRVNEFGTSLEQQEQFEQTGVVPATSEEESREKQD